MADLSKLSDFTTSAGALSNLILVNPQQARGYQPQTEQSLLSSLLPEPPKFLFHYETENMVTLKSDITDHYVEDNTAINDQIALAPETVKATGFIGELNNVVPEALQAVKVAADKLVALSAYEPELTVTALNSYNAATQAYYAAQSVADSAVASWASIAGGGGAVEITGTETADELAALSSQNIAQTEQQIAFQQFYGYWRNRTLFTVQTPWAIFKNMAIDSVVATQSEETELISSFEVNFKIMRFAETLTLKAPLQGRLSDHASAVVDLGTSTPAQSISLLSTVA